jgi:hypothetical protein
VLAVGTLALGACNPKQELLSPQQPGVINPGAVTTAPAADAVYVGALNRWKQAMNGSPTNSGSNQEGLWNFLALFTDELRSSDTFSQRNDADQRVTQSNDGVLLPIYIAAQQARGRARDAINALLAFDTTATGKQHVGEMYLQMGYLEDILSEAFCNGLSFGETVNGAPQYTAQMDNQAAAKIAVARFDTALTYLTATDAGTVAVKNAVLIARGRAQVDIGDFAGAVATVASVPTNYQYNFDYSIGTYDNEWWIEGPSVKRYTAGDSIDKAGPIKNAIPFAQLNDPRVSVTNTNGAGEDNITTFIAVNNWGRDDPTPPLNGIDARLIEAEAKLQAGDIAGMTTILNALRTAPQVIGAFKTVPMPALAQPADKPTAVQVFFREKALWQYERGWRQADLRRMVRQYGFTQDQVFPTGNFTRNGTPSGTFGTEVAFPIPDQGIGSEASNPNFHGCMDTKA